MLKNALKMLYLIAHFQKNFKGEAPRTPRCREVRGRKSSWKIGDGEGNQVIGNFIHPCF